MSDHRIYPLLEIDRAELEELAGGRVASAELLRGGLTNTLHRVKLAATGQSVVVKHYAGGAQAYADEVAALTRLAGILPVPEIIRAVPERNAIVYRWIAGSTLDDCRRDEAPAAFASLADPLGRFLAWVAATPPLEIERYDAAEVVAQVHTQLAGPTRARERMGTPLAEAVLRAFAGVGSLAWGSPCLCHHDLGGRNILVQQADGERWRIGGMIDWEGAATGSPLVDVGALFRYSSQYDDRFLADFAAGYREAGGTLPDDWNHRARLLDATRMVDTLDLPRELPGVFADCRMLLTQLVTELGYSRP